MKEKEIKEKTVKDKASKDKAQNIVTAVIVGIALILAVVVILVQTGVLKRNENETSEEETVMESRTVVQSSINEQGEVEYVTVLEYYPAPAHNAKHRFSTTTTKPTTSGEDESKEESESYTELSKVVAATDASGQVLYDENGEIQTEVVKYTKLVTTTTTKESSTETTTEYVPQYSYSVVTDKILKKPKKDKEGNVITESVLLNPTTTEPTTTDRWSETETTTKKINITKNYSAQDSLENAILAQINDDRALQELPPLTSSKELKVDARTNSLALFEPNIEKQTGYAKLYTFTSSYGGTSLYNIIATSGAGKTAMSTDVTTIGIGSYKSGDKYYTTIIFQ